MRVKEKEKCIELVSKIENLANKAYTIRHNHKDYLEIGLNTTSFTYEAVIHIYMGLGVTPIGALQNLFNTLKKHHYGE